MFKFELEHWMNQEYNCTLVPSPKVYMSDLRVHVHGLTKCFEFSSECDSWSDAMETVSISLPYSHGWRKEDCLSMEAKTK